MGATVGVDASGVTGGRSMGEVLAHSRGVVGPAMRAAVDTLPQSMQRIVGYHLGWLAEDGTPIGADGGKGIRPALALLAAEAVGGPGEAATPAAVAIGLVHNFSLMHDDVMDRDYTRRHRPTAWTVFGLPEAILAGDALLALAIEVLAVSGGPAAQNSLRMLTSAVLAMIDGQSDDVAFETRTDVSVHECVNMAMKKTGALLGCACALGATFGGGGPRHVRGLRTFGEKLGLAFQHVDDLLGIWGDPLVTGKPVHSDLSNRKKSLPVVAALTSGTPAGHELAALYHRDGPLSGTDVVRAADLVDVAGGRAWSQGQMEALLAEAVGELNAVARSQRAAAELTELARLIVRRDH